MGLTTERGRKWDKGKNGEGDIDGRRKRQSKRQRERRERGGGREGGRERGGEGRVDRKWK